MFQETALTGNNAAYIAELYANYKASPSSVDRSWVAFFEDMSASEAGILGELLEGKFQGVSAREEAVRAETLAPAASAKDSNKAVSGGLSEDEMRAVTRDSVRALMLVRAYRVRGHLLCDLDPLKLKDELYHEELDPKTYGFTDEDWDKPIFMDNVLGFETATLREIYNAVQKTYCGHIGVQFMHIQDPEQKSWIQERIEAIHNRTDFTEMGKKAILQRLSAAEIFEQYLHKKYVGTKRFGLDGAEALVPAIEQIMKRGGQLGLEEIVIGMPHRGRLNVLTNVMGKSFTAIFSEFQGNPANPEDVQGSGDVKYHLGTSSDRDFDGNKIHLSLTANPSHLEAVNPVVLGKVRAKQEQLKDTKRRDKVLSMQLHGDAAFGGEGLVAESMAISEHKDFDTGGTIHIVVNNQIGFTTIPDFGSSPHPTDVALMIQAPIFHVNGDDAEAVCHVARIVTEFRQKFNKEVVIDLVCYRRYGHNEGDEPSFTQPLMYKAIAKHPPVREIYGEQLIKEGLMTKEEVQSISDDFNGFLDEEFAKATTYKPNKADWFEGKWTGLGLAPDEANKNSRKGKTSVTQKRLRKIGETLCHTPKDFNANSKIKRQLKAKAKMFETGKGFDWATAEAMAYGALVDEGIPVRLSGQDCERGTFSQRHAVFLDQENGNRYTPLCNISEKQGFFEVINSPLSEAAVLGFEYGYTLAEPHALVLWEAQFGDFANEAQVIIDQFISCGELKWLRMSGLVMLLPHGYEGQGPEHSSARLERYLQLCGEDNMQVCNCSTPANYFHVLRRQMHRSFRKPLIIMTPKSLLRHKACISEIGDFSGNSAFRRVIGETDKKIKNKSVSRVVICSGKVYYDIIAMRDEYGIDDIAVIRLEQIYPFPKKSINRELLKYPNADVVWCQEEPENMGAWTFVDRRIENILLENKHKAKRPIYAGRAAAAAPATGLMRRHLAEQKKLVEEALDISD